MVLLGPWKGAYSRQSLNSVGSKVNPTESWLSMMIYSDTSKLTHTAVDVTPEKQVLDSLALRISGGEANTRKFIMRASRVVHLSNSLEIPTFQEVLLHTPAAGQ